MREAPFPSSDAERLTALASYDHVEAKDLPAVDALVQLASTLCDVPVALVALLGLERPVILSRVGLSDDAAPTRNALAFCAAAASAVDEPGPVLAIDDLARHPRLREHPFVTADEGARFYAAAPLTTPEGHALGVLCVLDRRPRTLTADQVSTLRSLSDAVLALLDARRAKRRDSAVAELARHRARDLAAVIDAMPDLVAYADRELRIRFANRGYARTFGHTIDSIADVSLKDLIDPTIFERLRPKFEAALRGESQTFARQLRIDGKLEDFRVTLTPDMRDGEVLGYVSTMTQVTELRDALRRSEQRNAMLEMTEEMAEVGHWRIRDGGRDIFWSPGVYRIHGRDPSTYTPHFEDALDAYHPDDRAAIVAAMSHANATKGAFEFEKRLVRTDGQVRRVLSRGRVELDASTGEASGLFGVFQDITERAELRERVERQERLVTTGTLAAGVGHEINNPLTYVAANIDFAVDELRLLGGTSPSGRMREVVEVLVEAREGADRIRKIVRGLRAFAREDTMSVPTDVHAALEISVNMAMHELRQRAEFELKKGDIQPVFADESRLSQVFVNLLVNAAHAFSNGDTSRNKITVTTMSGPGDHVIVEIADNGSGIKPDVLARIFDPFFTTKPIGQGTGLGLSICHNVVTAFGGEITCSTVVGEGTTFRVVLPAALPPGSVRGDDVAKPRNGRGRILLVDDEESVLRALTRLLSTDHDVVALTDPLEARTRMVERGESFDVVFCDIMMPTLSGIDLYRQVLAANAPLAERFVFVTGGTVYEEIRNFLADIPNERLEKPFSNQNLKGIARRFVELAQQKVAR